MKEKIFYFLLCISLTILAIPRNSIRENYIDGSRWSYMSRADSLHGFNVQSYDLTLEIDHENEYINGYVVAEVTAEEDLSTIGYEFVGMNVDSVKVNNMLTEFTFDNEIIEIALENISQGDNFTTTVYYSGNPVLNTNVFTLGMIFQSNYVFTISDPNSTRYWMPCYDHPWDKAIINYHVKIREDWLVACNGIRMSIEDCDDGTRIHNWIGENVMASYLFSISCGNFIEFQSVHNDVPLHNFAPEYMEETAGEAYEELPFILDIYESIYGDYPFEKYGNSIVNFSTYGAMEHQTMTTLDNSYIGTQEGKDIIAHEFSHQWFGNCLTPLTWKDVWLSESFATYSEALYRERRFGYENMVSYLTSQIHNVYKYWANVNGPRSVYNPIFSETFSPPVYEKGGSVLHMLRLKVGDETFFSILQTYFQEYYNSNVVTEEFIAVAEEISGLDLTQFFNQWIYGTGLPSLDYGFFYNLERDECLVSAKTISNTNTEFYLDVPCQISVIRDSVLINVAPETQEIIIENAGLEEPNFIINKNEWVLLRNQTQFLPELINVFAADNISYLFWNNNISVHNIQGYNIYRAVTENGEYEKINTEVVTDNFFQDISVDNDVNYFYKINAVVNDDFVSDFSNIISAIPVDFSLNQGILLLNNSNDGSGSLIQPSAQEIAEFYQRIMPFNIDMYSVNEAGLPLISDLSKYSTIIINDDGFTSQANSNIASLLGQYLIGGGNLVMSGWRTFNALPQNFTCSFLGLDSLYFVMEQEFVKASSVNYPDLVIDENKVPESWNNALPWIAVFDAGENIYNYVADSEDSENNNKSCGFKLNFGNDGKLFALGFPLYFIRESDAREFLSSVFSELNEVSNEPIITTNDLEEIRSSIYPSPYRINKDKGTNIKISFEIDKSQKISVKIFNIVGQLIYEKPEKFYDKGEHFEDWNLIGFEGKKVSSGIYFIKIKGMDSISVKKFIIID